MSGPESMYAWVSLGVVHKVCVCVCVTNWYFGPLNINHLYVCLSELKITNMYNKKYFPRWMDVCTIKYGGCHL